MRSGVAGPGPHSNFKNQFSVKARTNPGGLRFFFARGCDCPASVMWPFRLVLGFHFQHYKRYGQHPEDRRYQRHVCLCDLMLMRPVIFSLNMARVQLSKGPHVGCAFERSLDVALNLLRAAFGAEPSPLRIPLLFPNQISFAPAREKTVHREWPRAAQHQRH
jgi:hypothetical protein